MTGFTLDEQTSTESEGWDTGPASPVRRGSVFMRTRNLAMSAIRAIGSQGTLMRKARLGAVALLALGAGSCVISDKPLIVGSKPILGERFDAVLFRDFTEGAGYSSQKVGYRWIDGFYVRSSATGKYMVKFATESLPNNDLLVERTQEDRPEGQAKLFTYFIARKVADGAYLIRALERERSVGRRSERDLREGSARRLLRYQGPRSAHDLRPCDSE